MRKFSQGMKVRQVKEIDGLELGRRIREARKKDSRSLVELAAKAKMTTANWYVIEDERIKALPLETLRRIEKVLGIDLGINFDKKRTES